MKNSILAILIISALNGSAQRIVEKSVEVNIASKISLEFKYASNINVTGWDQDKVQVVASVTINDGESNDIYEIEVSKSGNDLVLSSNSKELENHWRTIRSGSNDCCNDCCQTTIDIEVKIPSALDLYVDTISGTITTTGLSGRLDLNTISGDVTLSPIEKSFHAKSISGDVELLVERNLNADFNAKTISGEIYFNLDFEYLDKKNGLRQIVGQKVRGRLNQGGEGWDLETISGNIYLRGL